MEKSGIYVVSHKRIDDDYEDEKTPVDENAGNVGLENIAFQPEAKYQEKEGLQLNPNSPYNNEPYWGMGKEDLLKHSSKPFWRRLRFICISIVLLGWLALIITVVALVLVYPHCRTPRSQDWWQKDVMYRVFVPSFQDSGTDGWGDLKGLTSRLDYLEKIGVKSISLSPVYLSRTDSVSDYEVTDHKKIDPRYGTEEDFVQLVNETHNRGMHLIMDFIPGLTSKHHPWFVESSASTNNSKKNFYVWQEGVKGGPPSNWRKVSGGSAWTLVPDRSEYYLHQHHQDLPALNPRSAEVKDELKSILQFWLNKGVDGFYIRESGFLFEDYDVRDEDALDATQNYSGLNHTYTYGLPEVYDMLARWRYFLDTFVNGTEDYKLLFADINGEVAPVMRYYGYFNRDGVDFPLNRFCLDLKSSDNGSAVSSMVQSWMGGMPVGRWASWMGGFDDSDRIFNRLDEDMTRGFLMLSMLLPGTPFYYYGDEIGMVNSAITGVGGWERRQSMRSPMQWDNSSVGGFMNESICTTACNPWMAVNDVSTVSVEFQNATYSSMLNLFKNLTSLRTNPAFLHGDYIPAHENDNVVSFVREFDGEKGYLVAINFGTETITGDYTVHKDTIPSSGTVEVATGRNVTFEIGGSASCDNLELGPKEGVVISWDYVAKEL